MITLTEARALNRKYSVIPLVQRIPADIDTPVSAYVKLSTGRRDSFLLESVEGGEKLARYSFVGAEPFLVVEGDTVGVHLTQGRRSRRIGANPIDFLSELFSFYRPAPVENLPRFLGGGVGYFSYDCARLIEKLPGELPDSLGWPLLRVGLYSNVVVFDHARQEILVVTGILHEPGEKGFDAKYRAAVQSAEDTIKRLRRPLRLPTPPAAPDRSPAVVSHLTPAEFEKMVRRAKVFIQEGDIFQVVLSQRWHVESEASALDVYRRLRRINPSPYMFLLNSGARALIGASPEMLVRVEDGQVETRPIAGTRPRGRNSIEDERLARDLAADPKELAEHTMLLDLGRNDIGRVSKPGTVRVAEQMGIEKYSHVMHLVSSVVGRLSPGKRPLDAHFACFPAGTVSGAPKVRAMEIIDTLERERRGPYAGSIAYIGFDGHLDSCIAIRTIVKDGRTYYVQAGAGIVADSSPAREGRETEAKARALIEAVVGRPDE